MSHYKNINESERRLAYSYVIITNVWQGTCRTGCKCDEKRAKKALK